MGGFGVIILQGCIHFVGLINMRLRRPEIGQAYWFIDSRLDVSSTTWKGKLSDELRWAKHNYFTERRYAELGKRRVEIALQFFQDELKKISMTINEAIASGIKIVCKVGWNEETYLELPEVALNGSISPWAILHENGKDTRVLLGRLDDGSAQWGEYKPAKKPAPTRAKRAPRAKK